MVLTHKVARKLEYNFYKSILRMMTNPVPQTQKHKKYK